MERADLYGKVRTVEANNMLQKGQIMSFEKAGMRIDQDLVYLPRHDSLRIVPGGCLSWLIASDHGSLFLFDYSTAYDAAVSRYEATKAERDQAVDRRNKD